MAANYVSPYIVSQPGAIESAGQCLQSFSNPLVASYESTVVIIKQSIYLGWRDAQDCSDLLISMVLLFEQQTS